MRVSSKYIAVLPLLLVLLASCEKDDLEPFKSSSDRQLEPMEQWLEYLCSKDLRGRKTGSLYDSLAAEYVMGVVREIGYEPVRQPFRTPAGTALRNILVEIPGDTDSLIVIGAHFDGAQLSEGKTWFPAANDNASGVVTLLRFLQLAHDTSLETDQTVLCCFWDGEEVFEDQAFHGSSYYVCQLEDRKKVIFYLNLDTIGHEHNSMGIVHSAEDFVTQIVDRVVEEGAYPFQKHETNKGSFSDFVSFRSAVIPYIGFHDHYGIKCAHANHSVNDTPEYISIRKLKKMAEITRNIVEYHE